MGYHRSFGERLALNRDIDVLFLGSTRDRRRRQSLGKIAAELADRAITLEIRDGSPPHGYVFGHDRTVLLNRSKILLHIGRQPWDDPAFRMLYAAACGTMLLSEDLWPTSTGPFRVGEHLATSSLSRMADSIQFYLEHEEERRRIAENAYTLITTRMTMGQMVRRILDALAAACRQTLP